ncbi:hypothetical protein LTR49_024929 [Elasticomyces elasticus]|nr:hypothetical protein LTR49_024929 [Elasticomyces elasticus]
MDLDEQEMQAANDTDMESEEESDEDELENHEGLDEEVESDEDDRLLPLPEVHTVQSPFSPRPPQLRQASSNYASAKQPTTAATSSYQAALAAATRRPAAYTPPGYTQYSQHAPSYSPTASQPRPTGSTFSPNYTSGPVYGSTAPTSSPNHPVYPVYQPKIPTATPYNALKAPLGPASALSQEEKDAAIDEILSKGMAKQKAEAEQQAKIDEPTIAPVSAEVKNQFGQPARRPKLARTEETAAGPSKPVGDRENLTTKLMNTPGNEQRKKKKRNDGEEGAAEVEKKARVEMGELEEKVKAEQH